MEPGGLRPGGEDGIVADAELHGAVAPCVGLSREGTELILCSWAEGHGLGKLGGLAGEGRAEAGDGAVVTRDRVYRDGWVELADEPALGAGVGLDVQGG